MLDRVIEQKFKKGRGLESSKVLTDYLESVLVEFNTFLGAKRDEIDTLYSYAEGVYEDKVVKDNESFLESFLNDIDLTKEDGKDELEVKFFPIIKVILNAIIGDSKSMPLKLEAQFRNQDSANLKIDLLTQELNSFVFREIEGFIKSGVMPTQDPESFVKSKQTEILKDFKTYAQLWLDVIMNKLHSDNKLKNIYNELLKQKLVSGDPQIAVILTKKGYKEVVVDERNSFAVRSTNSKGYEDSEVFGFYDDLTVSDFVDEYGETLPHKVTEEILRGNYTGVQLFDEFQGVDGFLRTKAMNEWDAYNNYKSYLASYSKGTQKHTIQRCNLFILIPRKVGVLTVKYEEETEEGVTVIEEVHKVDEYYKIDKSINRIYREDRDKTAENLILGEHLDYIYENELFFGQRLAVNSTESDSSGYLWVKLEKYPIQYKDKEGNVYIPVHGGYDLKVGFKPNTVVKMLMPDQDVYNYLNTRIREIIGREIGQFLLLNNEAFMSSEVEGEIDPTIENLVTARDYGFMNTKTELNTQGLINQQTYPAKMIDATVTRDVMEKFNLAAAIKARALNTLGFTDNFISGNIKPRTTEKSIDFNAQRVTTQLIGIFSEIDSIVIKFINTIIKTERYLFQTNPNYTASWDLPNGLVTAVQMDSDLLNDVETNITILNSAETNIILSKLKSLAANVAINSGDLTAAMKIEMADSKSEIDRIINKLDKDKAIAAEQEAQRKAEELQRLEIKWKQEQLFQDALIKGQIELKEAHADFRAQVRAFGDSSGSIKEVEAVLQRLTDENKDLREINDQLISDPQANDDARKERELELRKLEVENKSLEVREKEVEASNRRTKKMD